MSRENNLEREGGETAAQIMILAHRRNGGGKSISEGTLPSSLESKGKGEEECFQICKILLL